MYLYMLSGGGACHGQFIGNPFPFHDFPSSSPSHSPFNDHGEPVSSLLDRSLRLKARCLSASPHYSPFSGVFLVENNWPGHGSSRRLPHQRRWSRSHWGANQPSGSGCPWPPGQRNRFWFDFLVLNYVVKSEFDMYFLKTKEAHLRYLERLALILSSREAESPGLRVVLPGKEINHVDTTSRVFSWAAHRSVLRSQLSTGPKVHLFRWTSMRSFTMMPPTRNFWQEKGRFNNLTFLVEF